MICILSVLIYVSNPQIQASGQCIEYFEQLQANSKISTPLKLKVHSNTRWGSAYDMVDCALQLHQVRIPSSNYWTTKWQFAAHQSVHLSCQWAFRPYYCHSDKWKGHQEDSMFHLPSLWQWLGTRRRCPPHLKGMSWLSHLYKTISCITRILAISSTNLLPRMLQDSTTCSQQSKNFWQPGKPR